MDNKLEIALDLVRRLIEIIEKPITDDNQVNYSVKKQESIADAKKALARLEKK